VFELQPPKSSSGATLGTAGAEAKPPPKASESPHPPALFAPALLAVVLVVAHPLLAGFVATGEFPQPKSPAVELCTGGVAADAAGLVGAGCAHSFAPQGSLGRLLAKFVGMAGFGCSAACGAGFDCVRLNTEEPPFEDGVGFDGMGFAVKSSRLDVVGFGAAAGVVVVAELKSPKSPKPSDALLAFRVARGGGTVDILVAADFGGGLGPASKNPPPLSGGEETCGDVICAAAGVDLIGGDACPNPEKADGFDCVACCGFGALELGPKLRPAKASPIPPNAEPLPLAPVTPVEAIPPKELC
jgi:hypothetical protein